VVWIGFKAVRFVLPAGTDELIGSETNEALEAFGKIVSVEERAVDFRRISILFAEVGSGHIQVYKKLTHL